MGIYYQENTGVFHLTNDRISYIFRILENGHPGHLYFGKKVHVRENYSYIHDYKMRSMTACVGDEEMRLSLAGVPHEYSVYGTTDFRQPAVSVLLENGSRLVDAAFTGYRISKGKPALPGLPATYTEDDSEAETLEIDLKDPVSGLAITLMYTIFRDYDAIARSTRIANEGSGVIHLTTAMSFCLDLPDSDYEMIHFSGAWSRERTPYTRRLAPGIQSVGSRRGASSHEHNPFMILKRPNTNEDQGEAIGFSFVYSGNFLAQAEVDALDTVRVLMGIHPDGFDWKLEEGEVFQTPEAVCMYSATGLNALSQQYHRLYRKRLAKGYWRDHERPILLNNWEATYFDFNEEKLLEIAARAKNCGAELFVLDDGWFGARRDDHSGLGDWIPNPDILPNGIDGLARKVHDMGLFFGLWFEPEMVNENSDLYRNHPDWIIHTPGRTPSKSRHQWVLDYSRKEVVDYIYEMMSVLIRDAEIDYIKWDMNRYLTECYSPALPADRQGEVFHRHILGVYDLYSRLTSEFPLVLFESCSSGGARFDPGLLYYAPQCWTSDDTDAIERLKIQYGTSYCYPVGSMGTHVSAVPNHQLNRVTPLETRADVAYFGTFGYEMDLNTLTEDELKMVKEQIQFMKKYRRLITQGDFYRISSPFEGNETCWISVSEDKKAAIAGWYRCLNTVNAPLTKIRFAGLDPDTEYRVSGMQQTFYGDELMEIGIPFVERVNEHGQSNTYDFMSRVYTLKAL